MGFRKVQSLSFVATFIFKDFFQPSLQSSWKHFYKIQVSFKNSFIHPNKSLRILNEYYKGKRNEFLWDIISKTYLNLGKIHENRASMKSRQKGDATLKLNLPQRDSLWERFCVPFASFVNPLFLGTILYVPPCFIISPPLRNLNDKKLWKLFFLS